MNTILEIFQSCVTFRLLLSSAVSVKPMAQIIRITHRHNIYRHRCPIHAIALVQWRFEKKGHSSYG